MKRYIIEIDGADERATNLADWIIEIIADGMCLVEENGEYVRVREG